MDERNDAGHMLLRLSAIVAVAAVLVAVVGAMLVTWPLRAAVRLAGGGPLQAAGRPHRTALLVALAEGTFGVLLGLLGLRQARRSRMVEPEWHPCRQCGKPTPPRLSYCDPECRQIASADRARKEEQLMRL